MPKLEQFKRFSISDRLEHWMLTASFFVLAVTGLVQQHIDWPLYGAIIRILGGIENVRVVHHVAAAVLMFETIYHVGVLGYKFFVLRTRPTILPGKPDAVNAIQAVRYGVGLSKDRPQEGRFSFAEKMEYWAVVWGTVIMGITGFMLWNPIATTRFLSGAFVPAAKAAHGKEALLAVLAIILWHLYHVHIRHLNLSMLKGTLSREEMEDEHPQELADIQAGRIDPRPEAAAIARRSKIFFAVYAALALVMLAGIYFFVFGEKTAIATAPAAEQVVVFAPLTPTPLPTLPPTPTPVPATPTFTPAPGTPTETPAAVTSLTWQSGIADLMKTKCAACHSSANKMGGLDLSSYQTMMAGGISGPAIVPGEPNTSLLITRQASGNHPGQFGPDELQRVVEWIEAGALEK